MLSKHGLSVNQNNPDGDPAVNDEPYWPQFTVGTKFVAVLYARSPSGDGFDKGYIGIVTVVDEERRREANLGKLALHGCTDCGLPVLEMSENELDAAGCFHGLRPKECHVVIRADGSGTTIINGGCIDPVNREPVCDDCRIKRGLPKPETCNV